MPADLYTLIKAVEIMGLAINVASIATESGISHAKFARSFKRAVGATPKTLIRNARVRQSMELLRNEAMPLADIAFACGYCSQSHFCTAFKLATGLTPLGYRAGMEPIKTIDFR